MAIIEQLRETFVRAATSWSPVLSQVSPATIVSGIVLVTVPLIVLYRLLLHPLAGVPGPKIAAVNGLWRTWRYAHGKWHEDILELHDKYGPVVRVAPNEVSIVDGPTMKKLYGHGKPALKTGWYHTWHNPGADVMFFAELDPRLHSLKRKRVSAAYSMSSILEYEKYMQSSIALCLDKLSKYSRNGQIVDVSVWVQALAYDVVGELAFGETLGHLETETDVMGIREAIAQIFTLSGVLGHIWGQTMPFLHLVDLLKLDSPISKFMKYSSNKVMERQAAPKDALERKDLLNHFVKMKKFDGSGPADQKEILVETTNILAAGADTTSAGIRAALYYLGTHPEKLAKLRAGIDHFYDENNLDQPITYLQSQKVTYLGAVISETMRLFPSINFQLLRVVPQGGVTVGKYYIPAGCDVGISPLSQGRDPKLYGETRNDFIPERWEDPQQKSMLESYNMSFGGNGPRGCVGKNLALVEIYKFVAQFVRRFDFEFVNKEKPWEVSSMWSHNPVNMHMRLRERKQ
ncbi:hypothetical protein NW755_013918 [Fusarium falciforme]|uniref:Cytochrome P450 monooxygenase n=1 Tax=Fusarium falciforme TaxID=195108 RepID=A0A9W8UVB2_9HYPO|nr:hypothetical protein NW755_013918 [Fusarium falciforme]